jgi:hypothetical protein|tara:strand:- start:188 stop:517 length:330 start_codon:yes stop_codon:yes gene_type:complete
MVGGTTIDVVTVEAVLMVADGQLASCIRPLGQQEVDEPCYRDGLYAMLGPHVLVEVTMAKAFAADGARSSKVPLTRALHRTFSASCMDFKMSIKLTTFDGHTTDTAFSN